MGRATGSLETVLDGVIAEVDGDGRPTGRVDGIAERLVEGSANRWRRLAQKHPVAFLAFDLLWLEGHPVTDLAWSADVSCSMRSACTGPPGKHPRSIGATRDAVIDAAESNGLPGVVLKRPNAMYSPGVVSAEWLACDLGR